MQLILDRSRPGGGTALGGPEVSDLAGKAVCVMIQSLKIVIVETAVIFFEMLEISGFGMMT